MYIYIYKKWEGLENTLGLENTGLSLNLGLEKMGHK